MQVTRDVDSNWGRELLANRARVWVAELEVEVCRKSMILKHCRVCTLDLLYNPQSSLPTTPRQILRYLT